MIFDTNIAGHHIEYIHHLCEGMRVYHNDEMIIVLPSAFKTQKKIYKWNTDNCVFVYYSEERLKEFHGFGSVSLFVNSWRRTKVLKECIDTYNPDSVFLNAIVDYMPILPFIIHKRTCISGIIYKIYLYKWKKVSFPQKISHILNNCLYSYSNSIANVFVLNDKSAAIYLNKRYHTNKYKYLPDPFNDISYKGKNIREKLLINKRAKVYLHFGAMSERKGTLDILDAISALDDSDIVNRVFIFAGVVNPQIRSMFYRKAELLRNKCGILVFDSFCDNIFLHDLCVTSDYLLCPYKETDLSSGVIGYAAKYLKPVIGPQSGLIGKLIRKNRLGITIEDNSVSSLCRAIVDITKYNFNINPMYIKTIEIAEFNNIVVGALKKKTPEFL